jgi:hypothetical protein
MKWTDKGTVNLLIAAPKAFWALLLSTFGCSFAVALAGALGLLPANVVAEIALGASAIGFVATIGLFGTSMHELRRRFSAGE